jgi:hypothetical protein
MSVDITADFTVNPPKQKPSIIRQETSDNRGERLLNRKLDHTTPLLARERAIKS